MLKDYEIYADGFGGVAFFATAHSTKAAIADFHAWVLAETGGHYVGRHWADFVGHGHKSFSHETRISIDELAMRVARHVPHPSTTPLLHLAVQNTDRP